MSRVVRVDYMKVRNGKFDYFYKQWYKYHSCGTITTHTKEITEQTYYKNLDSVEMEKIETKFFECGIEEVDPYIKKEIENKGE